MTSSSIALPTGRLINKAFLEAGRSDVVKWDVFPLYEGARLKVVFESDNAQGRHGVWLMSNLGIDVNGIKSKSIDLWKDTCPIFVEIIPQTTDDRLHVYNIWDSGEGRRSQSWTSGMLIEDLPVGRRYLCNDIGLQGEFNDLIFRIEYV